MQIPTLRRRNGRITNQPLEFYNLLSNWFHFQVGVPQCTTNGPGSVCQGPAMSGSKGSCNGIYAKWRKLTQNFKNQILSIPLIKLDELTAHWHLRSPRSQSVISGSHCSLLDNTATTADFPPSIKSVCLGAIRPFLAEIYQICFLMLKIQGQGLSQDQTWWSHLRPKVQWYVCFSFVAIGLFLAEMN